MRRMIVVPEGTEGAVKTVRLDNCGIHGTGPVKLIKIDCEGSEIPAMLGARELIARDKPFLYVEHYVDGLAQRGYTPKDLTDCIESLGYNLEMVGSAPRWDWLCTPKS
jgi:hypothetical protein